MAEGVVEKFISQCINEVANNGGSYLPIEYRNSIFNICINILRKKRFNPSWEEIQIWFSEEPEKLKAIRELIQNEKLIRLTAREGKLIFRHDRIRETFLVENMISMLEDPLPNEEILQEPYYAEIIGKAIVLSPQSETFIENLAEKLPLALFEALKNFGDPITEYHNNIIDIIKDWVDSYVVNKRVLNSVINSIMWCLLNTDSSAILDLTQKLPSWPLILLSCLRNGSAISGANFCRYTSISTQDDLRDQIIEHARKQHKAKLLKELGILLSSAALSDEQRRWSLALAGFFEFPELENEIADCWNLANDKEKIIAEAIWAGARCCNRQPSRLLGPMMKFLVSLSDEPISETELGPRIRISEDLNAAMQRGICNNVIDYLINLHKFCKSLNWPIVIMLEGVDTPDAIELRVRFAAKESSSSFAWHMLSENWDPTNPRGKRLSNPSLDRLKMLWSSLRTDEPTKYQAFRIWANNAQYEQIDILKEVPPESSLYRMAIRRRAQLGDMSVAQQLASYLSTDIHMFDVAHNVWCGEILAVTEQYIESIKDKNPGAPYYSDDVICYLSELLTFIPAKDSEALLEKYWGHLRCIPKFIQVALYIGTEKSLKLADSSIRDCPGDIPVFKMLEWTFGFLETGRKEFLTRQHLERLAPYIDKLDDLILWHLAELCQRLGIPEWKREEISSRLPNEFRTRLYPTDEDLLRELDEFSSDLKYLSFHFDHWTQEFDSRHDPRAQIIVERWFDQNRTLKGLQVVAAFLEVKGTRKDLALLDKYEIVGPGDEISRIKDEARFSIYRRSLD